MGRIPFVNDFTSFSLFAKYLAKNIINPSLLISDGCNPKVPIPNQLLEPLRICPIPGINTNISKAKHPNNIKVLFF
jgi:hypothetical protein